MDRILKVLACFVAVLALGIGAIALAASYPQTKGKRPHQFDCPHPQCTEVCDPAAPWTGYCSDGVSTWQSTMACCCCNENYRDRTFRPPK